jgi:hypothetical protein
VTLPSFCLLVIFSVDAGKGAAPESAPTATAAVAPTAAPHPGAALVLSRLDALYADRDNRRSFDEQRRILEEKAQLPTADFETLWRAARTYFWLSDDPSRSAAERSQDGKIGWDYAERAVALAPQRPEGHYWAAVNIGSYALGLGVIKALSMGLEGKFKERLGRAEQLAPAYNFGGVGVAWGRFYEKLPWPKRDRAKAEQNLRKVLTQVNPNSLRARVYLADTLSQDGRAPEAMRLLDEVAAAPLGKYDAAEEHRAKALGDGLRPAVTKRLK